MGDNCRLGTERLLGSVMYVLVKNQITHFTVKIALGSSFAFFFKLFRVQQYFENIQFKKNFVLAVPIKRPH